jgi:hypothetical protein
MKFFKARIQKWYVYFKYVKNTCFFINAIKVAFGITIL